MTGDISSSSSIPNPNPNPNPISVSISISIDRDVCIGAGQCALTAPGVFTQDDDGYSELLPGKEDGGGDPLVREAARACPVSAITVSGEGN